MRLEMSEELVLHQPVHKIWVTQRASQNKIFVQISILPLQQLLSELLMPYLGYATYLQGVLGSNPRRLNIIVVEGAPGL